VPVVLAGRGVDGVALAHPDDGSIGLPLNLRRRGRVGTL